MQNTLLTKRKGYHHRTATIVTARQGFHANCIVNQAYYVDTSKYIRIGTRESERFDQKHVDLSYHAQSEVIYGNITETRWKRWVHISSR